MLHKDEHRALINKYLNNTLSEHEKAVFIQLLNENPDLKEQVMEEKRIVAALRAGEKARLKDHLKAVVKKTPPVSTGSSVKWWLAAASAALIMSLGYLFYLNNTSIELTFDEFYEPYPAISAQRGEVSDVHSAVKLYSEGRYEEAIKAFDELTVSDNPVYYLYLGNSYLQTDKPDKAIEAFEAVGDVSDDIILKQHARWYLALSYLRKEDLQQTRNILNEIINHRGIYTSQAKRLSGELD